MRHPRLIAALLSALAAFACPEAALQLVDPWHARQYFGDMRAYQSEVVAEAARGYLLPPGIYRFSDWTATILSDGTRFVPDTHPAACRIALVGDSVTFGHGVNDGETWANALARAFPAVQILNAGVNGYNAVQVRATIETLPADGYFYLLIANDADPAWRWPLPAPTPGYRAVLPMYLYVLERRGGSDITPDYPPFDAALAALKARSDVQIVGFEDDPLARRAAVPAVPHWTHTNSVADGHANGEGNGEIARAVQPYVQELMSRVCPT